MSNGATPSIKGRSLQALLGLLVLALVGTAWVGGTARAAAADDGGDEAAFVAKINDLRASKGLGTLAVDSRLVSIARNWSAKMRSDGALSHNPNYTKQAPSNWRKLAENVGTGNDVDQVFKAFVNSPKHYANLTDPELTYVGVGVVRGSDGRLWTTHDFMDPQDAKQPSSPPQTSAPTTRARRPTTTKAPRAAETPRSVAAPTTTAAPVTTTPPTTAAPAPVETTVPPTTDAPTTTVAAETVPDTMVVQADEPAVTPTSLVADPAAATEQGSESIVLLAVLGIIATCGVSGGMALRARRMRWARKARAAA